MRDEGGLKTEDRRQRTEGRGRKTGKRKEDGGQPPAHRGLRPGGRAEVGKQEKEKRKEKATLILNA